jgi:hypothetical protein
VWALGCLFYSYIFGYSPFECAFSQQSSAPYVVESSYLRILGKIPRPSLSLNEKETVVLDLVSWMLNQIPTLRPFCSDVLSRLSLIAASVRGGGPVSTLEGLSSTEEIGSFEGSPFQSSDLSDTTGLLGSTSPSCHGKRPFNVEPSNA